MEFYVICQQFIVGRIRKIHLNVIYCSVTKEEEQGTPRYSTKFLVAKIELRLIFNEKY
jgi:hypothetical protein